MTFVKAINRTHVFLVHKNYSSIFIALTLQMAEVYLAQEITSVRTYFNQSNKQM